MADDAHCFQLAKLCLCHAQLIRIKMPGLREHRAARGFNGMAAMVYPSYHR